MKYKKKILITGGCGFIGFNLALELLKKNFKVVIIDKKITNKIRNKNVTYVKGNIKNSKVFNNFEDQYEAVFHLAAQASARICEENFKEAIETNFIGTYIKFKKKNNNFLLTPLLLRFLLQKTAFYEIEQNSLGSEQIQD